MSSQDKEELMSTFKSLDKDGDGKLTKEELVEGFFFLNIQPNLIFLLGYLKLYNNRTLAEEEVDKIIKECDQNLSGNIDFTGKKLR